MNKTQAIFATLTARYGKPEMKDGQNIQAVAQSFESALAGYSLSDLSAACQQWMASTKWPRWPEPAEMLEILRSFGAKQETKFIDNTPHHIREAQNDASAWHRWQVVQPLPQGAWPFSWDDAIAHIIGVGQAFAVGKSFGWLLTRAWLNGDIPANFDYRAGEFFTDASRRKHLYLDAVRQHGALAVHERRQLISG